MDKSTPSLARQVSELRGQVVQEQPTFSPWSQSPDSPISRTSTSGPQTGRQNLLRMIAHCQWSY